MTRHFFALQLGLTLVAAATAVFAAAPAPVSRVESKNMELVGHHDLQARTAYQPVIQRQGDRYIAYVGHHGDIKVNPLNGQTENNGTSIIDVTNPKKPVQLAHVPGETGKAEQGGSQMVRVCGGDTLPKGVKGKWYMLRVFGNAAHEIWDVTDPAKPSLLTTVIKDLKGTHKNWWECDTGIAYLVSGVPGWRANRMTQIFDLSDPANPVFIRNFGLPGQEPGATGAVPMTLHGAYSTGGKGNRVYFGYGTNQGGILQIVDRDKLLNGPKEPTPENLLYPQVSRFYTMPNNGAHTVFPLLGVEMPEYAKAKDGSPRDFIVITNESIQKECLEGRQQVWFVDITTETKPMGVSNWTVKEAEGNYCTRGGRYGAHSSNEAVTSVFHKRIMFFTWFNAGLRALDVRDPYNPQEIAYYIPAMTQNTIVLETPATQRGKVNATAASDRMAIQSNNVDVDDRGYIYVVDRANTGMHILQLTGAARAIANWPQK